MNQNTNNSKTSTLMLIYLIIILLTPPITALITLLIQLIKQKNRIENSKEKRILSLNNITIPITADELYNIDRPKCFLYNYYEEADRSSVRYYDSTFLNIKCSKEYIFDGSKLNTCIFHLNKSCNASEPKRIFRELRKTNGDPDEIHYDKDISLLECIWYGKNGSIMFRRFVSNMVEIIFEIKHIS